MRTILSNTLLRGRGILNAPLEEGDGGLAALLAEAVIAVTPDSLAFQDVSKVTPASTHGDSIVRLEQEGLALGDYSPSGVPPTVDLLTIPGVRGLACGGSGAFLKGDDPRLSWALGQGFHVYAGLVTSDTNTNRGVAGKWNIGGSPGEWILMHRDFSSPNGVLFGAKSYYDRGGASDQVNDGLPHVLSGRHTTGNNVFVSVDGSDVTSGTAVAVQPGNTVALLHLGAYDASGTTYFTGTVYFHFIFDRALTPSEDALIVAHILSSMGA